MSDTTSSKIHLFPIPARKLLLGGTASLALIAAFTATPAHLSPDVAGISWSEAYAESGEGGDHDGGDHDGGDGGEHSGGDDSGGDDSGESGDDHGDGEHGDEQGDDSPDDDGTPDQGPGDVPTLPIPGDDDGTPDQGPGDN